MAIKITMPDGNEIEVNGAAEYSQIQELIAATKMSEKEKKTAQAAKDKALEKETAAIKKHTSAIEEAIEEEEKKQEKEKHAYGKIGKAMEDVWKKVPAGVKEFVESVGDISGAMIAGAAKFLKTYDSMAEKPVQAGADMLQLVIDIMAQVAKVTVKTVSAVGQTVLGWIPFVGDGLAAIVQAFEGLAVDVINFAAEIGAFVNEILRDEFQKRIDALNQYAAQFVSLAGGLADVANLAAGAGLGIKTFSDAVKEARPYMTQIGLAGGDAARELSRAMSGLATTTGRSGRALRDELLAMGISFSEQGGLMAQYMAQLRSFGRDIRNIPAAELARGTADYAKHLRVLSDLTGQDAAKLMEQARAEAQRGALMDKLTANQSKAFQDSFAIFSSLPEQQGAKLQSALAQLLAGGVITDPVIAGNAIIMDMLKTTAGQISRGNVDMVSATQQNLAMAADQYRIAGDSVTDFATLMNPTGTSAVAQGMSQFGNALRQYRYDPKAAQAAMDQTESMAQASGVYVAITEVMVGFQVQMEALTGSALPMYTEAMIWASETTIKTITQGIDFMKKLVSGDTLAAFTNLVADMMGAPASPSGQGAEKAETMMPGLGRLMSLGGDPDAFGEDEGGRKNGGISTGPTSGYYELLHGTEAVVPLPDGKTIPVAIDAPPAQIKVETPAPPPAPAPTIDNTAINSLTAAVNEQTSKMSQLVSLMEKNNNLTSGILQHSM